MRLLIIEDDKSLLEEIRRGLQQAGFAVDVCVDGKEGEFLADTEDYDAVVLIWDCPVRLG